MSILKLELPENGYRYFVDLDLDKHRPARRPDRLLLHGVEVIGNALSGELTDQLDIARRLWHAKKIQVLPGMVIA